MIRRSIVCAACFLAYSAADAQTSLGNFSGYTQGGSVVSIGADSASVRFSFLRPDVLKIEFAPLPSTRFDSSFAVLRDTSVAVAPSVVETESTLTIASAALQVHCTKSPLRFSFLDGSGKMLLAEPASGGLGTNGLVRIARFTLAPDDHFYGTGERGTAIDKRGLAFDCYNTQQGGYTSALPTMNINVPFLCSSRGYALYFDNTYPAHFDLGSSDPSVFSFAASGGELRMYVIAGPTVPDQLEAYTWLTGRQPLPPRWAFGFIQSKYGYHNDAEARLMVQTMRQKQIPCDAIVLDLYWYASMGDLAWNTSSWPDPFGMMGDFLSTGIKTIVITEPYIVQSSANFAEASGGGYLAADSAGQPFLLSNWWSCGCPAGLLDITNPSARSWWWSKHPSFFGTQLAGIWTDLGEPERHPSTMQHFLGSVSKIHNIYSLLWARTIFEGYGAMRPNSRLFNLTRAGFAGIQRYGVIPWSGDVGKSFGGLSVQIPMLLGMGMSALAYENSDIGGFCCGTTTPELYSRWMEYGTFCPITRAHGTGQPTEPWGYDSTTEAISRSYIQLRYRLLPYIYTTAYQNTLTGMPLARPLFFDHPDDPALVNESSSYLWGDEFLVSPVVQQGATSKTLYLPAGSWIDYWTDSLFQGGRSVTVAAPLDRLPLFVKSGSIVPMQPVMNWTDEHPADSLTLLIYPASGADGTFALYEDDGATLDYQTGSFARTVFTQRLRSSGDSVATHQDLEIDIGATTGSFTRKPASRLYLCELHRVLSEPSSVTENGSPLPAATSLSSLANAGRGYWYDISSRRLYVQVHASTDSAVAIVAGSISTGGITVRPSPPQAYHLAQNYPNPFNPVTKFEFQLPEACDVTMEVFDLIGRKVATLVNERKQPGSYTVAWDATNEPSGVYFYRLRAGKLTDVKKMSLMK